MHGWAVVLFSLAGTVLLVGGVGVLSVMLISFSDRRYEIGLRKAIGADDGQILVQFLLEALVLAALGATVGTLAGSALCRALSDKFPWGLVVNPYGLAAAWGIALVLAVGLRALPRHPGGEAVADGGDAVGGAGGTALEGRVFASLGFQPQAGRGRGMPNPAGPPPPGVETPGW